jgi:glycosyltransferase involved in cell wall biosynthesis
MMLVRNRCFGVYREQVDAYIALTDFAREKLSAAGLPPEKMHVKPNFLDPDPGMGTGDGDYGLFVGRLDAYKGVSTVLNAWKASRGRIRLRVVGAGTLADEVREAAGSGIGVEYIGPLPHQDVCDQLKRARFLVYASEIYEGLPRVLMEALAVGTPVLAAKLGAAEATIREGETGLFFEPGDAQGLASAAQRLDELAAMREACRKEFLSKYTADIHYRRIIEIYESVTKRGTRLGDAVRIASE